MSERDMVILCIVVLSGTEAVQSESVLMCPDDLISKIQPVLNQTLVREFDCIYKFVVVDDNGAAIYHLDLKHGMLSKEWHGSGIGGITAVSTVLPQEWA